MKTPLLNLNIQFFFLFLFFLIYNIAYYRHAFIRKIFHIKIAYFFFGLFGYFIYFIGLFQSFRLFNVASNTAILNYTFPIFTVIFRDILFKSSKRKTKKVRILEYGGLFLGFLSIIIVATKGQVFTLQFSNIAALLWGLLSGISYGIFSAYSSSIKTEDQPVFFLSATCISWLISLFIALPEFSSLKHLSLSDYFYQAVLAFIVNGLGFITWARANRLANIYHIPISSIASLLYILPFLSLTIIAYFLKETSLHHTYFVLSLLLLILGTYICQKSESISNFLHNSS